MNINDVEEDPADAQNRRKIDSVSLGFPASLTGVLLQFIIC